MKEYGYFSNNGYVITDRNTPRHWYNYLFNNEYIASVSQVGFGNSYAKRESGEHIPTIADRAVYIVEDGRFWQANGLPVHTSPQHYHCDHNIGFTDIVLTQHQIKTECRFFVGTTGKREFLRINLTNNSRQTRTLKVIPYYAPSSAESSQQNTIADFKDESNCVISRLLQSNNPQYIYMLSSDIVTGYDTRSSAFIGLYGSKQQPLALYQNSGCTNSKCIAEKSCLVLENTITIAPGECKAIYYIIGIEDVESSISQLLPAEIEEEFNAMLSKYSSTLDTLYVRTPWDDLDNLCNDWLKYQTLLGSLWAKLSPNDTKTLLSNIECLIPIDTEHAARSLLEILPLQHNNGYISDGSTIGSAEATLSLIAVAYAITKESGSFDTLQQRVPFSNGEIATVYEHAKRALSYLWNNPGHGGMLKSRYSADETTTIGKGINVDLSITFVRVAKMLSQMANWMGSEGDSRSAAHYAQEMQNRINRYAWNEDRYIYAISDQKHLIGGREGDESCLFATPQIQSVLSDFDDEHRKTAMDTLEQYLNTDLGLLYNAPAHPNNDSPNLIGIGKNGGIELVTAVQKIAADAQLQRNDKIEEGLRKILPAHNEYFQTQGEPYALFDYYFGYETDYQVGQPSESWLSETGPRLLYILTNFVFGLKPEFGGLILRPCLPPSWKDCSITKLFRQCRYNIHYFQKDKGNCNNIDSIYVNGIEVDRALPIKPQAGKTLNIEVILKS